MKLLPPPFGWDNYSFASISLLADDAFDRCLCVDALEGYSCYPPAITKILNCLTYSGRYDCYVQLLWIKSRRVEAQRDFLKAGVRLVVHYFKEGDKTTLLTQD